MEKNYKKNWLFNLKAGLMVCAMFTAGGAFAQLNGTYTIDAGSAKSATNFTSFEQVADTLNDEGVSGPVVINVTPKVGGYEEQFELGRVSGTSATNTITVNGNKTHLWVDNGFVVRLNGTKWVTIDNLKIETEGTGTNTTIGIILGQNADNNTISNNEIIISKYTGGGVTAYVMSLNGTDGGNAQARWNPTTGNVIKDNKMWNGSTSSSRGPRYGLYFDGQRPVNGWGSTSDVTVSGNDIMNFRDYGYYGSYSDGHVITDNEIHDNRTTGGTLFGIYLVNGVQTAQQNIEVSGNEIRDLKTTGTLYGIYGITLTGLVGNPILINENMVHDNESGSTRNHWSIILSRSSRDKDAYFDISKNEIYNNLGGSFYAGIQNQYHQHTTMTNNLIYQNDNLSTTGTQYAIRTYRANENLVIANNTSDISDGQGLSVPLVVDLNDDPTNFTIKNNILHTSVGAATNQLAFMVRGAKADLIDIGSNVMESENTDFKILSNTDTIREATYVADVGDETSRFADPQYANIATGDYTPTNPGIANMGEPGYVTDDIDGDTRTACGPDPGAQEFFTDLIASNVSYITTTCGNTAPTLTVDITNNYGVDLTNFAVGYTLNSDPLVTELVTDTVKANSTKTITFANPPSLHTPGANTIIVGLGCDDNDANNTETINFTVLPVPSGGELVEGTNFEGYFRGGTEMNPDVTVFGYPSEYDITRPTQSTFAASGAPGTDYTYALSATTAGGVDVTTSGFSLINSDETILADPATSLTDSLVWIQLTATSVAGNCDTMFGRWMYVPHTPDVSFDAENVCLGDVSEFLNTSTLEGNDYMLNTWEFDDPDASVTDDNADIQDGFYSYTTFGTAEVVLTVWNGVYPKFKYSDTANITITPKPLLDYKVLNACEGSDVEFVNSSTLPVPGTITYEWDFNGEGSSTDKSPKFTFTTPGQRVVTLKGTANGCVAELDKNAYQFENPVANFSSTGACNFVDVDFLNTSTIPNEAGMGFAWDFGDGGISRLSDPAHAFATPGSKTVKLTATSEFGCVDEYTGSITLNESPEADFEWDAACNLTPVQFTRTGSVPNGGANSSYTWDFAGLGASGQENPNFLFSDIGPKAVMLTVSDLNGCSSSITKELSVVLQAVADFNVADVCEGDDAVFTNKSTVSAGNLDYVWSFGDPDVTTSTDLSPRFAYPESGTTQIINVTLQANVPGGCSDEITKSLTVNAKPDASFTADVQGRTVVIDGPSGNDIYQWRFGEGGSDNAEDPTYTYNNVDAGTFEICLATKNAECWNESCETVVVNLVGVAELTLNNEMINVYPNPSSGNFNLVVSNASEDVVIKVADLLGNEISIAVTDNLNGVYAINLDAVADGVYFVQVKNGDYYATKRITVAK